MGSVDAERLIGREEELRSLSALLREGEPLITLWGPGGVGKTSLARALGACATGFEKVRFCDLASAFTTAQMAAQVAETLGIALRAKGGLKQLEGALASERSLLILDNFEQLPSDAAKAVGAWVGAGTSFVVTSRAPLQLSKERRFPVTPLSSSDCVALFVARCSRAGVAVDTQQPIAQIADALDHLPLAVELAAALSPMMSPQQILRGLQDRLSFLENPARDAPARHASLASALQWSWELMSEQERAVMSAMLAFRGGCTPEAAQGVLTEALSVEPARHLRALVDKSLLFRRGERLHMLESMRAFVEAQPAAREVLGTVEAGHAKWFCERAEVQAQQVASPRCAQALAWLQQEHGNLVAAYERERSRSPSRALRIALALNELLYLRGPFDEQLSRLRECATIADASWAPRVSLALGNALMRAGALEASLEHLRPLSEDARDPQLRAQAMHDLGRVEYILGHWSAAEALCERGILDLKRRGRAQSPLMGYLLATSGDLKGDLDRLNEALVIARQDPVLEARVYWSIGRLTRDLGGDGSGALERALELSRSLQERRLEALVLSNLATAELVMGRHEAALQRYAQAIAHMQRHGQRVLEAWLREERGAIWALLGRYEEGMREIEQARLISAAQGDLKGEGWAWLRAAQMHRDREEAQALLLRARSCLERAGDEERHEALAMVRAHLDGEAPHEPARLSRRASRAVRVTASLFSSPGPSLWVGLDSAWFEVEGQARVDLSRRRPLAQILKRLVDAHRSGEPVVSRTSLIQAGWPKEQVSEKAADNRLRNAIATLRRLGLRALLLTQSDGYLLQRKLSVTIQPDEGSHNC